MELFWKSASYQQSDYISYDGITQVEKRVSSSRKVYNDSFFDEKSLPVSRQAPDVFRQNLPSIPRPARPPGGVVSCTEGGSRRGSGDEMTGWAFPIAR